MREEKFFCPECDYVGFENAECPECGSTLKKVKGDDYVGYSNDQDEGVIMGAQEEVADDFDPTDVSWYSDEESYVV